MLNFLPLFRSGRFIREEIEAVAAELEIAPSGDETEPDSDESAGDHPKQAVGRGLEQLERAGIIEFEPDRRLYTFHQTLLDHVSRISAIDPDRDVSLSPLLKFHIDYVRGNSADDSAIDRCMQNIFSNLEVAWGLRENERTLDSAICFVVDWLGDYFLRASYGGSANSGWDVRSHCADHRRWRITNVHSHRNCISNRRFCTGSGSAEAAGPASRVDRCKRGNGRPRGAPLPFINWPQSNTNRATGRSTKTAGRSDQCVRRAG